MSDEWKFRQQSLRRADETTGDSYRENEPLMRPVASSLLRRQEAPGAETPRPRLVTNIPLEPREESVEPKVEEAVHAAPPGYTPQVQSPGHGGMTGYPPPVAGGGYAHEYTPYPPGYPQPYAPPMGGYPPAMPEAGGQPGYGFYAATPAGPVWQPYYPPYGVPQGMPMPYGYASPYGMPPMPPQGDPLSGPGMDTRTAARPMPDQGALQGAQPMEARPSRGVEPNEPGVEAQAAQPPAFQAAYPVPQAYPMPQMSDRPQEAPHAMPVLETSPALQAQSVPPAPLEQPPAPTVPMTAPAYAVASAYPTPQWNAPAQETPQAEGTGQGMETAPQPGEAVRSAPVAQPAVQAEPWQELVNEEYSIPRAYPTPQTDAQALEGLHAMPVPEAGFAPQATEAVRSMPVAQPAMQPIGQSEPRQEPVTVPEAYPAPGAYPTPQMNVQAAGLSQETPPAQEIFESLQPEKDAWQTLEPQAETTVHPPWAASAAGQAPWSAEAWQEEPAIQAAQPLEEAVEPEYVPAEATVERRRRSERSSEEDGAMAAPVEKAAYTIPVYSQPVDSDAQLVTRDDNDDDDDIGHFSGRELREMPTPVTVPLMLNTINSPTKTKKKGGSGWLWLLPVVLLIGSLSAVFFTGAADSLLMRAGIPTWEELTVEKIRDEELPSVFAEETAAPGSLDPSYPEAGAGELAGDASQEVVAAGAGVVGSNLPALSSFTVQPDSGTAPVTLVFTMQSNNAVKSIQLANAAGEKLTGRVTSAPSGDGIAWQFEVRFDKAYEGEVHVLLEGQEKGGWYDTDLVCRVTVD